MQQIPVNPPNQIAMTQAINEDFSFEEDSSKEEDKSEVQFSNDGNLFISKEEGNMDLEELRLLFDNIIDFYM